MQDAHGARALLLGGAHRTFITVLVQNFKVVALSMSPRRIVIDRRH